MLCYRLALKAYQHWNMIVIVYFNLGFDTMAANPNQPDNDITTTIGSGNNSNTANKPNLSSSDPNTETESPFITLVRRIKISDLEKEIKEDGETTSILGKFKEYEKDLTDMAENGMTPDGIVAFVVDCIGISEARAILFATRLRKAYPKQSNGM